MINRYLIIGLQRSGTTLLHTLLRDHPDVSTINEELRANSFFTQGISAFTFGHESPEEKAARWTQLFDALSRDSDGKKKTWGLKTAIGSPAIANAAREIIGYHLQDLKIIRIIRKDQVAQFGSHVKAELTGHWHNIRNASAKSSNAVANKLSIKIRPLHFARYCYTSNQTSEILREIKKTNPYLELVYEEMGNLQTVSEKIYEFLSLSQIELNWPTTQKVSPPARNYIANYDQLEKITS